MNMIGIDIGGTFTDFVIADESGAVRVHKLSSTPADPAEAFMRGLRESRVDIDMLDKAVHGTTVGTNALIERRGAITGLITTQGFRDVLEIRRSARPPSDYFNLRWNKPAPLVPRELIREVDERTTFDGQVIKPLDADDALRALRQLADAGCTSVAICLLFSYANPSHEQQIAAIASEHFPDLALSVSSSLLPQWREYERASTTVADAFIKPRMSRYFSKLVNELRDQGMKNDLLVMKSNSGLMTARSAASEPIHTLLSGPAGGALAGKFIGARAGYPDLITMDMGGTSFDVSLVQGGAIAERTEASVADGLPIQVQMVDIRTIGAGGGSVGWLDSGGVMKVGPRSAGAAPGPACYGRGGVEPTITDANLVLGRLSKYGLLGGDLALDVERSNQAVDRVAEPLGLERTKAANGIVTICVSNMVNEVRTISAQQGLDPRDFTLIAGGGAGPLHATLIADTLGMDTVIVPPYPGLLSAAGLLLADLKFDIIKSWPFLLERSDLAELDRAFAEMVDRGKETLRSEGFEGDIVVHQSLDMRYQGQNWEISVAVSEKVESIENLAAAFDRAHHRLHGVSIDGAQHEVVNLRVSVVGPQVDAGRWLPIMQPSGGEAIRERRPVFDTAKEDYVDAAPVYERAALKTGDSITGCCIVDQVDSTTYVPSNWAGSIDQHGNLILKGRQK
ncbi:MAG: hydantoinase/oxoprolinase family protein [Alphaproteobacteria bacterium]|nr:hydantoinase/oxoprolinase family protein [Alphaproteobacteria bacterium]